MERSHRHDMGWRELCQQAAKEQDPERLIELVQRLNEALEERQRPAQPQASETPKPQKCVLDSPQCCPAGDLESNGVGVQSSEGQRLAVFGWGC